MSEGDAGGRGTADLAGSTSPSADRAEADRDDDDQLERLRELVADLDETTAALVDHGAEHDLPAIEYTALRIRDTVRILEGNVPAERVVEDDHPEDDSTENR